VEESGVLGRIGAMVPKGVWGEDTDGGAAAGAGDDDKIVISPPASSIFSSRKRSDRAGPNCQKDRWDRSRQ
jgi:hypothetical protein